MPAPRKRPAAPLAIIGVSEAAALMGVTRDRAYTMAAAGTLPGLVKLPGCRLMVRRAVLEAALRGEAPWPGAVDEAADAAATRRLRAVG